MKKTLAVLALLLIALTASAQIWSEDFAGQEGKGMYHITAGGILSNMTGITKWSIGNSNLTSDTTLNWWMVTNSQFEGQDVGGAAYWLSESIDVSGESTVTFSMDFSQIDIGFNNVAEYFKVLYSLDGGDAQELLTINQTNQTQHDATHYTTPALDVSLATGLIVRTWIFVDGAGDGWAFDNVEVVSGSAGPSTNVQFTASADSVAEATLSYTVTVYKTVADGNVSGQVELGGTAVEGALSDYTVDSTNFTMNGATTAAYIVVTINDDADVEAAETVTLALANVEGGSISAPNQFTLTIEANDQPVLPEPTIWINEISYDAPGTDSNEFVEVAGPAATDLSNYILVLYDGTAALQYNQFALSGTIDDEACGYGALAFDTVGIQNGSPDGIALIEVTATETNVIQFLSYEGSFMAGDGLAAGYTSVDVGTQLANNETLQLGGTATNYSGFTWETNVASMGSLNVNQGITGCGSQTTVQFTASAELVSESSVSYTVTVYKSDAAGDVSGNVALGGTATEGGLSDYTIDTTNFTMNGGTTSATFVVTINDDADYEPAETIVLTLSDIMGGVVGTPGEFTLTIAANDFGPSDIIISQYIETDTGTEPKGIEVWNVSGGDITFDGGANMLDVKVGVGGAVPSSVATVTNGTLVNGDVWVIGTTNMLPDTFEPFTYNGDDALTIELGGVLQDVFGQPGVDPGTAWTNNGVSSKDQNIQLKNGITDGDKVGWSDPSLRFEFVATGTDLTGFGTPPMPPTVATNVMFTESSSTVTESSVSYTVTVYKSISEGSVTGEVGLSGTAVEGGGNDYTISATNFTLNGATTAATVVVTINDDGDYEPAETIVLTLANVMGGTISAPSVFTLTVTDNDPLPLLGSEVAVFRFNNEPHLQVTTNAAGIVVSDMAISSGSILTNETTGTYFPDEPYVDSIGGWTASDAATAKNYFFTITPEAGKNISISGILFRAYATAAGPSVISYDINGGAGTFSVDTLDSTLMVVSQAVAGVDNQSGAIVVMIQGWTNGSRATSGGGSFRLDDVTIYGSIGTSGGGGDTDGDGMPDDWETTWFTNATAGVAAEDSDDDGFSNLQEYLADTIPNGPGGATNYFAIDMITNGAGRYIRFYSSSIRTYTFQANAVLADGDLWTNLQTDVPGTGGELTLDDDAVMDYRNYRIRVRVP